MVLSATDSDARILRRPSRVAHGPQKIGVVLPAYNEAAFLPTVIGSLPPLIDHIYLVDDCSDDQTPQAASEIQDPRVTYIRHEANLGVGGAVVTGYRRALADGCDFVVKMDADGQMDAAEIERLLAPLLFGVADYVKGSRFYVACANRSMPRVRRLGSVALSFMTKVATGYWHIFDSQCGFTAVRSSYLRLLSLDGLAKDYFFENSMLLSLNVYGARVVDMPVTTIYGEEVSGIRYGRILFGFPVRLFAGWLRRFFRKYYLVDFGAIAALVTFGSALLLFGIVFGAVHWAMSAESGIPATTGTVMLAAIPLIVGIQLLLQALVLEISNSPGAGTSNILRHEWAADRPGGGGEEAGCER
jgi:dolichol-phosphate mannosyltransferase